MAWVNSRSSRAARERFKAHMAARDPSDVMARVLDGCAALGRETAEHIVNSRSKCMPDQPFVPVILPRRGPVPGRPVVVRAPVPAVAPTPVALVAPTPVAPVVAPMIVPTRPPVPGRAAVRPVAATAPVAAPKPVEEERPHFTPVPPMRGDRLARDAAYIAWERIAHRIDVENWDVGDWGTTSTYRATRRAIEHLRPKGAAWAYHPDPITDRDDAAEQAEEAYALAERVARRD